MSKTVVNIAPMFHERTIVMLKGGKFIDVADVIDAMLNDAFMYGLPEHGYADLDYKEIVSLVCKALKEVATLLTPDVLGLDGKEELYIDIQSAERAINILSDLDFDGTLEILEGLIINTLYSKHRHFASGINYKTYDKLYFLYRELKALIITYNTDFKLPV